MEVLELDPTSENVIKIISDIDELMNSLYPQESNQLLSLEELKGNNVYFIGIIENHEILGCGAIVNKSDDGHYGELKRIYVKSKHRGKGVSKVILQELITHAKSIELPVIRLEAGIRQPEALSLYTKLGFKERAEFGSYQYDPLSIYMELEICAKLAN